MKVVFSHPYAITESEGLDRAVLGLAEGLRAEGIEVGFVSLQISRHNLDLFRRLGPVSYQELRETPASTHELGRLMMGDIFLGGTSRRLSKLLESLPRKSETILLTAQEFGFEALVKAARSKLFKGTGWWAFGTPHLYPSNWSIRRASDRYANLGLDLASLLSPLINRRFWELQDLDLVIAGSGWLGDVLSHFGGLNCRGVVYPPTDLTKFRPVSGRTRDSYVFAIGDNKDIDPSLIASVSRKVPVLKAGSYHIDGAVNLGYISDEELCSAYSGGVLTLFPTNLEQFGLSVAESLACGTPVLTFPWQGPGELVLDGKTGWKASTREGFVEKAVSIFQEGYDETMREYCRRFAEEKLSTTASAKTFLTLVK